MKIFDLCALELGRAINKREIGVKEALLEQLKRVDRLDEIYGCYITVLHDEAAKRAEKVQKLIDAGEAPSPLAGVPMAIKDNICTKGILTTCASRMLYNFKPPYDATVVEKLNLAGAVIIGKLNMDEFAMGSTCETSHFKKTKNPWDTNKVPGGSSGGSAAAISAKEAFYALGSDTGGSIRQPAAYCGVTGIKPTYGAVSRYGLIAYASSLDQIGTFGYDAADCAAALEIISGYDEKDSTSVNRPVPAYSSCLKNDIKGKIIGVPSDWLCGGVDKEVKQSVLSAAKIFEGMGARVEEFPMPIIEYAVPAYYIIACAEASSNLARYDGIKYGFRAEGCEELAEVYLKSRSEGFGPEVKRRIMLGSFVLSSGYYDAYYKKAQQVRMLIKQAFNKAYEKYDMILAPVAPTTAQTAGESLDDPLKMYLGDIHTVTINLAGLPSVALPCGLDSNGLPVGMQLIGNDFCEQAILNAAFAYQSVTDHHRRRPPEEV